MLSPFLSIIHVHMSYTTYGNGYKTLTDWKKKKQKKTNKQTNLKALMEYMPPPRGIFKN